MLNYTNGNLVSKPHVHGAVVFLQQAHMFRSIFPLHNPSLHKTCNQLSGYSEGTQRLSYKRCYISLCTAEERVSGEGRKENPALLFGARTE